MRDFKETGLPARNESCLGGWPCQLAVLVELAGPAQELALVGRHFELIEDGVHRTDRFAVSAVDAGRRVDVVHLLFIGRGDAAHRADLDAGRVLNPDAGFGDNESQNFLVSAKTTSRLAVLLSD